ncbi:MAG TPA: site-specific integrase [Phycisphaerales bacterium]|nr:site-specific integrase [Phycisphaerales bacterium]HRQ74530.1 site-specific integrase [Phycisphaerales bacterium]
MTVSPEPLPEAKRAVQGYIRGLAVGSQRTVAQSLDVVAKVLTTDTKADRFRIAWHQLGASAVHGLREALAKGYMPATVNKMLSCVRGVLTTCHRMELMTDAQHEAAAVPNVPMIYHPEPADVGMVGDEEVGALLNVCARAATPGNLRDAALLAILLNTGLRRAEAIALDRADYRVLRSGSEIVAATLLIRGLISAHHREVVLAARSIELIEPWLAVRGDQPGPLLLPVNKSGVISHRRLTDQAIYDIIRRLAVRAHLPHITTRGIRRSYVASLIASGLPVEEVAPLCGHASWLTTESYQNLAREIAGRPLKLLRQFAPPQEKPSKRKKGA